MEERNSVGWAVAQLQAGLRVRRAGWNGKGMYLFLVPGSTFFVEAERPMGRACPELVGHPVDYHAHVDMKTAQGYVIPWLCSQADLLAQDWELAN
jgi:hypothetical protein